MAVISAGKGSSSAAGSIKYVQYEKGTTNTRIIFSDGINCSPYYKDAIHDFALIRDTFQKYGGREAHHMVLAFSPSEEAKFTPKELFQKSIEIAKETFPNYQVWLGMHDDTEHLHVHIIINSINLETGNKLQIAGRKGMYDIMERVQEKAHILDLDNTLSIGRKQHEQGHVVTHNIVEHKLIEHGQSWKADIAEKVYTALEHATSKTEFILRCNECGLICNWSNTRKHITFAYINEPLKKVRNTNLAKTFTLNNLSSKDTMQAVFRINKEIYTQQIATKTLELEQSKPLERERTRKLARTRSMSLGR